ncbi:MAG: succinate dehydrogenase cytochrome b subunit [Rhodothermales bacterium]|nr:succinate dehydrogenase cytochrome b subunit [Rhodothermales bacterium]
MSRVQKLLAAFRSPIGRKLWTGITGLGLTLFVLAHMSGNLSYFSSDPQAYNKYAEFLTGLGPLFYAIELGLLAFFVIHAFIGISIWLGKKKARPVGYKKYRSSGQPSKQSLASRTMIVTGSVLLVFLVVHILSFKYGPGVDEGYVVTVGGAQIRDLKTLLEQKFNNALYAFGYPAVMLLLAFHLRHGIWSAFQSLGATNPRLTPLIYTLGGVLGLLIAVGFLVLPLYIFFFVEAPPVP